MKTGYTNTVSLARERVQAADRRVQHALSLGLLTLPHVKSRPSAFLSTNDEIDFMLKVVFCCGRVKF